MDERARELQEGYMALRHNPFWLWLRGELAAKRDYLSRELLNAASWEDCCRGQGALNVVVSIMNQITAMTERKEGEA